MDGTLTLKRKKRVLFSCSIKMKCAYNYCVQSRFFYASIPVPSICNQSIPIYLSIGIDNRYQSITTRIFAIDWSSIININRLIDIDWSRLISIVIDYRFHRLDTPGEMGPIPISIKKEKSKNKYKTKNKNRLCQLLISVQIMFVTSSVFLSGYSFPFTKKISAVKEMSCYVHRE